MTTQIAAAIPALQTAAARAVRIATVLISNAIPLVGVLYLGWSALNVLALYWFENLFGAVFTSLRIGVHRRLTRRSGHWRQDPLAASPGEIGRKPALLRDYATIAFPFTLGHGIFVIGIAIVLGAHHPHEPMWQFDARSLLNGAGVLFATLLLDFCVDRMTLRSRPFAWLKAYTQQRLGRVVVLHLAIIAGMIAMGLSGSPLAVLYVLIGLKTLWDLATSHVRESAPKTGAPPAWMLKAGERLLKGKGGAAALAEHWSTSCATARRQAIEDERPMPR